VTIICGDAVCLAVMWHDSQLSVMLNMGFGRSARAPKGLHRMCCHCGDAFKADVLQGVANIVEHKKCADSPVLVSSPRHEPAPAESAA